jgi:hypothetical protein
MPLRRTRSLARTAGRTAVIAGTATAVSGHVAAKQQARAAQQSATVADEPPAQAPPPSAMDPAVIEQLRRFAELRDEGILTEEEFAAQKAKLLGD